MLPCRNGLELQKRIADDRSDMPIIFISGYGDVPMTVQDIRIKPTFDPIRGSGAVGVFVGSNFDNDTSGNARFPRARFRRLRQGAKTLRYLTLRAFGCESAS